MKRFTKHGAAGYGGTIPGRNTEFLRQTFIVTWQGRRGGP
jgi:hypothetical protein